VLGPEPEPVALLENRKGRIAPQTRLPSSDRSGAPPERVARGSQWNNVEAKET
jgi:hypothetical protein